MKSQLLILTTTPQHPDTLSPTFAPEAAMSIILSFLVLLTTILIAASANNATTSSTVGWVADPTGRGTFSLIFSCILTLGLCVWCAMHLNIPPHDESLAKTWMRNVKWGLIGVVAPELVVFAAWRQYNSTKELQAEVYREIEIGNLNPQRKEKAKRGSMVKYLYLLSLFVRYTDLSQDKLPGNRSEFMESMYPWTMVHSFYAGMGGFHHRDDCLSRKWKPFFHSW